MIDKNLLHMYVADNKEKKDICNNIIVQYHSYVPTFKSVGRRIDWVIEYDTKIIGMIGIGSSTYPPPKDLLRHLNITIKEYKENFNSFANNWRYCLSEKIQNIGTIILKQLRMSAKEEWFKKYGNELKYILTFVGGGHNGAVYKADNWSLIGETSGLPSHKSSSMKWNTSDELKTLFVKPTGENKKLIFLKKL